MFCKVPTRLASLQTGPSTLPPCGCKRRRELAVVDRRGEARTAPRRALGGGRRAGRSLTERKGGGCRGSRAVFRRDPDDGLAEILAAEQPDEAAGGVLQAVDEVLAVLDPAVTNQCADLGEEIRLLTGE